MLLSVYNRLKSETEIDTLVRREATSAFSIQLFGTALSILTSLILARLLGAERYGYYALVVAWVTTASTLALLGQDTSVVRLLPGFLHLENWGSIAGLWRRNVQLVLLTTISFGLVGVTFVFFRRDELGRSLEFAGYAGCVLLPLLTLLQLCSAFMRGLMKAAGALTFNLLVRPAFVIAAVLLLVLFTGGRLEAYSALLASCVGTAAALVVSGKWLSRMWPANAARIEPVYRTGEWFNLGIHLAGLSILGTVMNRIDVLILGAMAPGSEVGPYYIVVQIAALSAYGLNAVTSILAPVIARQFAAGRTSELSRTVHRAAWLTFGVTVIFALGTVVAAQWFLPFVGPGFEAAYAPLLVIVIGQCFNAAVGPVGYLITMTRYERAALAISVVGAVLNILLCLLLIPAWGMMGAAVATSATNVVWNMISLLFVLKKLGINPTILPLSVHVAT